MLGMDPSGPRRVGPATPDARDWALASLAATLCVAEVIARDDIVWPLLAIAVGLVLAATILLRRTHPLLAVLVAFGTIVVVDVISVAAVQVPLSLYSAAFALVLVYSLLRTTSMRGSAMGMAVVLLAWAVSVGTESTSREDAVGGALVLLLAAALGLSMRYRATIRAQQFEHVRSLERGRLARELHDTVAHHVSAIAIQAQAGAVLASSHDTEGAVGALKLIEQQASMTLRDMRAIVGALRRDGAPADLVPRGGIADIEALASAGHPADGPVVTVERRGPLRHLNAAVESTLFRVAQEGVTNARRHARHPTRIGVLVEARESDVSITVTNDGEPVPASASAPGYGLMGMAERTALLGGALSAGPLPGGGWRIRGILPREGGQS